MTPEMDSRPEDLEARVEQILEAADDQVTALDDDDESREEAVEELRELGERANELVEDSDPKSLLAAVDSSEDSLDFQRVSLATAMSESDSESVAKLRTILTLSKLPDADEDTFTERVEQIRDLRSLSGAAPADTEEGETTGDQDSTTETGDEATDEASESAEEAESDVAEEADADAEADKDKSEQLKQKLQEGIDEFREGIDSYRDSLTEGTESETESEEADSETDTDDSESTTVGDGEGSTKRGGAGTTFSTMPSRNRVGMRGTPRFSTVRRSRSSNNE